MNDNYENFLIREMNEPQNPEGELDPTESPDWGLDQTEPVWNFNELKWKDGGAYYDPRDE